MSPVAIQRNKAIELCNNKIKTIAEERLCRETKAYDLERKKYEKSFWWNLFNKSLPSNKQMEQMSSLFSDFNRDLSFSDYYGDNSLVIAKKILSVCESHLNEDDKINITIDDLHAIT